MLSGKKFRLTATTLGIENMLEGRIPVQVPAGETILVLSGPKPDDRRMIDVLWRHKPLVMFVQDIQSRGEEIVESYGA